MPPPRRSSYLTTNATVGTQLLERTSRPSEGPLGGMQDVRDIAEFTSDGFSPFLPEDSQVNPEVYGAELAFWLSRTLAAEGCNTSYPIAEDWGWFLEYGTDSGSIFAVHCVNVDGSRTRWSLALRRFGRKMFGRDKPPYEDASHLVEQILRVLESDDSISEVDSRWPG